MLISRRQAFDLERCTELAVQSDRVRQGVGGSGGIACGRGEPRADLPQLGQSDAAAGLLSNLGRQVELVGRLAPLRGVPFRVDARRGE